MNKMGKVKKNQRVKKVEPKVCSACNGSGVYDNNEISSSNTTETKFNCDSFYKEYGRFHEKLKSRKFWFDLTSEQRGSALGDLYFILNHLDPNEKISRRNSCRVEFLGISKEFELMEKHFLLFSNMK